MEITEAATSVYDVAPTITKRFSMSQLIPAIEPNLLNGERDQELLVLSFVLREGCRKCMYASCSCQAVAIDAEHYGSDRVAFVRSCLCMETVDEQGSSILMMSLRTTYLEELDGSKWVSRIH